MVGGMIMGKLLIIKTGSSNKSVIQRCGDCDFRIAKYAGLSREDVIVSCVYKNSIPISLDGVSSIIITGSPAMVTDKEPWCVEVSNWLKDIVQKDIAILGICFGHQLLAHTLGGSVDYHKLGEEKGEVDIQLTEEGKKDPLLSVLPADFSAHAFHKQTVTKLPYNAKVLARNHFESSHAVAFGNKIWGVQFHPEYTDDGVNVQPEKTYGARLLKQFVKIAG